MRDLVKSLTTMLLCLTGFGLSGLYAGEFVDKHVVLPVQAGKVVLGLGCENGENLSWNKNVLAETGRLKQGGNVWGLTENGKIKVELGALSCFEGTCKANYTSIDLNRDESSGTIIGVVPAGLLSEKAIVSKIELSPVDDSFCNVLLKKISIKDISGGILKDGLSEIKEERKCESFEVNDKLKFVMAKKSFMQINGYPLYISKGMLRGAGARRGERAVLTLNSGATGEMRPVLRIQDEGKPLMFLWRTQDGIGTPAEVTHQLSDISHGYMHFGKSFRAGGQPCD